MRTFALPLLALATVLPAQDPSPFQADHVARLSWRGIGPANPVGRITDIEVVPHHRHIWYVGTAGGGVFKTTNSGVTWQPVFDRQGTASIGDIAVAPANPDIVWVGTGEENARNSVSWGDGVYKSTDGGRTWQHMGLREVFQIGHVAIHPRDPDIVYVAALGRLWSTNPDRGVFKTTDGGRTWKKVLYVDDRTGCIDVRIDPQRPDILYACMYERMRDMFDGNDPAVRFGERAGLFKSEDGGETWRQLQQGLPDCKWGRSGLSILQSNPDTLFAIIETERSGWATGSRRAGVERQGRPDRGTAVMGIGSDGGSGDEDAPGAILSTVTPEGGAEAAGLQAGDRIVRMDDEPVRTYEDLLEIIRDSRGGDKVKVTYVRDGQEHEVELTYGTRGSSGFGGNRPPFAGRLGGQVANRQDRQGDDGYQTGGVFRSDDRGETWTRVNSLTDRPFYYSVLAVDPQTPDNIYSCGVNFYASHDGGKTFRNANRGIHVDFHAIWVDPQDSNHLIVGCDGGLNVTFDRCRTWQVIHGFSAAQYYKVTTDNSVPYNVIGGLQDNGTWVGPSRTRYREGITEYDWRYVWSGDGFGAAVDPIEPWIVFATSQNGGLGAVDLRTGTALRVAKPRPESGRARFNWDSPFILSPHNRLTLYFAGNHVYRAHRYAHLDHRRERRGYDPLRNRQGLESEIISPRLSLSERGTATAIAESPLVPGLLYVGTDDGALWRSPDGGHTWQPLHDKVLGLPGPRYVSHIEPSHHDRDRVYVTFEGHRSDDMQTYAFVSEDRGESWRYLADDLPVLEPVHVLREDPRNQDLLFAGTEFSCYVSLDRGETWLPLGSGLPTVSVRDLAIQDRDSDLVAGTHGRGVWIVDIEPLRQLTAAVAAEPIHLFEPEDAILWRSRSRGFQGQRQFRADNPDSGVILYVACAATPAAAPEVTIHDVTGKQIAAVQGEAVAGLQRLRWNARGEGGAAPPGTYTARLKAGDDIQIRTFALRPDPESTLADETGEPVEEARNDR